MTKEAIIAAASKLETTHDLLKILNDIKMEELGDKGFPFSMPHLNYLINPSRNKKNYTTFRIPKKSGGEREISAPSPNLKSFLTYTNILLQAFYEAPDYVTGFVPGKSVVDNAELHIGMNYVFNTDLKDFFPSISKSRVWATLKCPPFNFNDTVADAIAGLCCTEVEQDGTTLRCLPQGSPSSPILTNIVCRNLDRKLHGLAKKYRLRYSRYADDITFSSNRNVFQKNGKFQEELNKIITEQRFTINEKKTRLQKKGQRQEVTGLIVSDRVNVTRAYVRYIDNILYIWEKYGKSDAYARFLSHYTPKHNLHNSKPNMQSVIQGKLLYLKMVKGADSEVWRRLQRRFNNLTGETVDIDSAAGLYRYTITAFEKKAHTTIDLEFDSKGVLQASFTLQGNKTSVALSKYARTRLTTIIKKDDSSLLKQFKDSYMLVFYQWETRRLWRIERKRRWTNVSQDALPEDALTQKEALVKTLSDNVATPSKDITEEKANDILKKLITSNFDLNVLNEWDKTSNS